MRYCYQPRNVVRRSVGLSVTLVSPAKTAEPIEMPFGWLARAGSANHVLDGGVQYRPMGRGNFLGKEAPVVKYRDFLQWAVQNRLNRSICRLGLGRPKEAHIQWYSPGGANVANDTLQLAVQNGWIYRFDVWVLDSGGPKEAHVQSYSPSGATWRIQLSRPSAATMRPYVKLLWPLVIISPHRSTT